MQTRGELYQKSDEETNAINEINLHLKQAYECLKKAEEISKQHFVYGFSLYWDTDNDGEPMMMLNYETPISITVSVDSLWMSSNQDC